MVRQLRLSLMVARKSNPDDTHQRRGHTILPVVSFTSETYLSGKKEELLPRDINNQRLIPMISDELIKDSVLWLANRSGLFCNSKDDSGDISSTHDYTHLISLSAQAERRSIYFRSGKPDAGGSFELYHINGLKESLGHNMCSQLLIFIHQITGYEMTFRIFGVGKLLLSRSLQKETLSFDFVPTHSPSRTR